MGAVSRCDNYRCVNIKTVIVLDSYRSDKTTLTIMYIAGTFLSNVAEILDNLIYHV
jgi:hypothetical protein